MVTTEVFAHLSGRNKGFLGQRSGRIMPRPNGRLVLLRYFREAVAEGVDDQFEPVRDFELGKNRAEVVSDGRFADEESFADQLILKAFRNEDDDLSFTR